MLFCWMSNEHNLIACWCCASYLSRIQCFCASGSTGCRHCIVRNMLLTIVDNETNYINFSFIRHPLKPLRCTIFYGRFKMWREKKVVVYQAPRPQVLSPSSPEYLWNRNRWRKEKGKKRKKIINDIKVSTFLCSFSVTLYFIAILPFFAEHQKCVNEPQLI